MRLRRANPQVAAVFERRGSDFRTLTLAGGLDPAVDWCHANLRDVDFGDDDLTGFRFHGARLHGADFRHARGLDRSMFLGADWDETTRFPSGLGMPPQPWRPPFTLFVRWREPVPGMPEEAWPDMVTLPAGVFTMGAPEDEEGTDDDERPQRAVTMPRRFALGGVAVTFAQWDAAMNAGFVPPTGAQRPADRRWGRKGRPVINVSWDDAQAYCAWLNERLGLRAGTYRLPSEAEWEYACRAGATSAFSFGDTITKEQVNHFDGRGDRMKDRTVPVGSLPANDWGLHEMHGNVWEWCEDRYGPYPDHATDSRPLSPSDSSRRVLRGGSWNDGPRDCRSAQRSWSVSDVWGDYLGFRLARTLF